MTLVEIGRVTRPHGIRGEVRVELHFSGSDILEHVDAVALSARGGASKEWSIILARRASGKTVLLKLRGVDDRDAADALRGAAVSVPRTALPEPSEGEYYLCDLVGARVESPVGAVGTVVEVRVHPSVDTLVIRTPEGKLVEQALAEPWILRVDADAKLVELASSEGLI